MGVDGHESKEGYKIIDINVQMHQQKLSKINQQLCSILAKATTPFIVIEYPNQNQENIQLLNLANFQQGQHVYHGRLFQYANPRNKETIKFIKNMEKEFTKITKLNNQCYAKFYLY